MNIALVNELKMVFDRMGIDIWEVLDAASTKPFGFMRFNPGPGWGGHCIPLDPFYLVWKAREYGMTPKFIELAGEVNVQMPHYVIEKLQLAPERPRQGVEGEPGPRPRPRLQEGHRRRAREPGLRDPGDCCSTAAREVCYHDPHVAKAPRTRARPDLPPMESQPLTRELLESQDAVLIVTDHTAVDYALVARTRRS